MEQANLKSEVLKTNAGRNKVKIVTGNQKSCDELLPCGSSRRDRQREITSRGKSGDGAELKKELEKIVQDNAYQIKAAIVATRLALGNILPYRSSEDDYEYFDAIQSPIRLLEEAHKEIQRVIDITGEGYFTEQGSVKVFNIIALDEADDKKIEEHKLSRVARETIKTINSNMGSVLTVIVAALGHVVAEYLTPVENKWENDVLESAASFLEGAIEDSRIIEDCFF